MAVFFHLDLLVAVHTEVLAQIDAETGAASVKVYDAGDVLLATLPLDDPAGTVTPGTGQLVLSPDAPSTWQGNGTADYATLCDGAGKALMALPCSQGSSPVADTFVLTTLTAVLNAPVALLSATIG
jgi:hypothetical protein